MLIYSWRSMKEKVGGFIRYILRPWYKSDSMKSPYLPVSEFDRWGRERPGEAKKCQRKKIESEKKKHVIINSKAERSQHAVLISLFLVDAIQDFDTPDV